MSKTGTQGGYGTAEGAVLARAIHAFHADQPILNDTWAFQLLDPARRAWVENLDYDGTYNIKPKTPGTFVPSWTACVNVANLRYVEDEVDRCIESGIDQYVILGAGFDTFALRRADLTGRMRVYEIDHPDVQALKRQRISLANSKPDSMPTFVSVDFESATVTEALKATTFDPKRCSIFSLIGTIPYLSHSAIEALLRELKVLMAPGSRLVLSYNCDVPLSEEQHAILQVLEGLVSQYGEPVKTNWRPEAFEKLLQAVGFAIVEHATEQDLHARYFSGRADGLKIGIPVRLIVAEPSL